MLIGHQGLVPTIVMHLSGCEEPLRKDAHFSIHQDREQIGDAVWTNLAPIDLHNEGLLQHDTNGPSYPKELKQQESIDGHLG